MSVTKEFMLFAAGLLLTVSFIFIALNVYKSTKGMGEKVLSYQERELRRIEEYRLLQYDGMTVNGNKVLNYLKYAAYEYGESLRFRVTAYGKTSEFSSGDDEAIGKLSEVSDDLYINPFKNYRVAVSKDRNGAYDLITITQED